MKKLFLLFALLCAPAFGQVYSEQAMQNTQGNWLKSLPGALVYLCNSSAVTTDCLSGIGPLVTLYTDQTLTVSGSNPVTADSNGNYTLFTFPGIYLQCVKGATSFCQMIQIGGNGVVSCANALNGSLAAFTSTTNLSCDRLMGTDFAGNGFAQSWRYLGPVNGFFTVIGGAADPGTVPAYKLGANSVRAAAPATVGTSYYWHWPATRCAVGQAWQVVSQSTDANGDPHDFYGCFTPSAGGGGGTQFQVNSVNLLNCSGSPTNCPLQNLLDSSTTFGFKVGFTNPSGGSIQTTLTTPYTQVVAPTAPTLTPASPGSTHYTYAVVARQDSTAGAPTYYVPSTTTATTTGNANLATGPITLSGYGDTEYGVRCWDIYRTASSGTPNTTGMIARCVGKSFKDNGLAGDGSSLPVGNTTQLWPTPASPSCNIIIGQPMGIDAPPCSPNAADMEFTWTFGAPGDTNDGIWTWVNQNSSTAAWTNGVLALTLPDRASSANLNCLMTPVAAGTSYTYEAYINDLPWPTAVNHNVGLALYESGTSKFSVWALANGSGGGSGGFYWQVQNWTSTTAVGSSPFVGSANIVSNGSYLKIQRSGSTLNYFASVDGVSFTNPSFTQSVTTPFTTAPDMIGFCGDAFVGKGTWDIDFLRRLQ